MFLTACIWLSTMAFIYFLSPLSFRRPSIYFFSAPRPRRELIRKSTSEGWMGRGRRGRTQKNTWVNNRLVFCDTIGRGEGVQSACPKQKYELSNTYLHLKFDTVIFRVRRKKRFTQSTKIFFQIEDWTNEGENFRCQNIEQTRLYRHFIFM